ncbi:MAG TPA: alpha-hydroxy-acid oxidizing protein [Gammaproteobacteria bacterium]|nr:alpha-hydroxy-acid oxidizing protein [Gammaproteobacteria bacterium]
MPFATLTEMAQMARNNLDRNCWDYLMGAADTESALNRNRHGLDSWVFLPRVLNDVSQLSYASELLGQELKIPVILPPIGSVQVFESGGGTSVAAAAQEYGTLQVLSSSCLPDFEQVAKDVPGPRVYQLYLMGDQIWMDDIIERAVEAGYIGFCLTVDTQTYSRRERDIHNGFKPPGGSRSGWTGANYQARITTETIAHIKQKFDISLFIKGVNVAEDAERCVAAGVDVVWVSNHGGRQLDHTRACIDALPEVAAAVDGRVPVIVDGGFMRGADIVKGLCLGADIIAMGRLQGLAMAAAGQPGLVKALELIEVELRLSMGLLGVADIADLNPNLMERTSALGHPSVLSPFPLLDTLARR